MEKEEQSAIDAIYEILKELKLLRKEVEVIDKDIKLLNNKVAKINQITSVKAAPIIAAKNTNVNSDPNQLIKVFGKIKNQHQKPIKDVYISILNSNNETIKSRTSDSDGYWEARLPAGEYIVELDASHINSKFRPKNINIEINESMHEFEVK